MGCDYIRAIYACRKLAFYECVVSAMGSFTAMVIIVSILTPLTAKAVLCVMAQYSPALFLI